MKNLSRRFGLAVVLGTLAVAWVRRRRRRISWQGKVVAITGGSRGLGLELARILSSQGARVALIARDEFELARAASELGTDGAEVSTWQVDILAEHSEAVLEKIASHHGALDVLINNAGEIVVGPFDAQTIDDFEHSTDIHLHAPLRLIKTAVPIMREGGGGHIANISSIGGKIPVPHLSAYCAGKFALCGLSVTLRAELASDNIVVTTVSPGLMRTGSHWNARFKGAHEREFAWFGHGATIPGISIDSRRAARQIATAIARGDAEAIITWQARAATLAYAMAPSLFAALMSTVARLLPKDSEKGSTQSGWKSRSKWMPSFLTKWGDRAAKRNNELGPAPSNLPDGRIPSTPPI